MRWVSDLVYRAEAAVTDHTVDALEGMGGGAKCGDNPNWTDKSLIENQVIECTHFKTRHTESY